MDAFEGRSAMMMAGVSDRMIRQWADRLGDLERIEVASRESSLIAGWRVMIHIRILRYLLSRYAEVPSGRPKALTLDKPGGVEADRTDREDIAIGVEIPREYMDVSSRLGPGIETMAFEVPEPPRRASVMKPTLSRIRETNIEAHPRREPGWTESVAWQWWEVAFTRRSE